jgi:hypothetical protein
VSELDEIERWFFRRGLPHFVERRESAWEIWARAIPLLVIAYLLLGLNALDLREWSWRGNVAAAAFVVVVLVLVWMGSNLLRGRRPAEQPRTVGPIELGLLIVVPAIPSAVLGQWADVVQTLLEGIAVLLAIWALTSYGVLPLLVWAGRRTWSLLPAFGNLIFRVLPLLLLFMTFLFVNAEVWEVAGTLHGPVYVFTVAIFFVLGSAFLISRLPLLMIDLNTFGHWSDVAGIAGEAGIVSDQFIDETSPPADEVPHWDRPSLRQRFNIGLVALFSQGMLITATAVSVFGFFVLFGFLAIGADTISGWTGLDSFHTLAETSIGGRRVVVSEPLLRVAGFLGAFAGMYFTVVLSTDATYREEFAEDIGPELRQALAIRALYRHALARQSLAGGDQGP